MGSSSNTNSNAKYKLYYFGVNGRGCNLRGLLSCGKYLPAMLLSSGGFELELTVAPADEAVLAGTGRSVNYTFTDLVCELDTVNLTSELQEQYSQEIHVDFTVM